MIDEEKQVNTEWHKKYRKIPIPSRFIVKNINLII